MVPRFFLLPVFGSALREYIRNSPVFNLRIIASLLRCAAPTCRMPSISAPFPNPGGSDPRIVSFAQKENRLVRGGSSIPKQRTVTPSDGGAMHPLLPESRCQTAQANSAQEP